MTRLSGILKIIAIFTLALSCLRPVNAAISCTPGEYNYDEYCIPCPTFNNVRGDNGYVISSDAGASHPDHCYLTNATVWERDVHGEWETGSQKCYHITAMGGNIGIYRNCTKTIVSCEAGYYLSPENQTFVNQIFYNSCKPCAAGTFGPGTLPQYPLFDGTMSPLRNFCCKCAAITLSSRWNQHKG